MLKQFRSVQHLLFYLLIAGNLIFTANVSASDKSLQLVNHPSAYLRLHSQDPVGWKTWNKSVLQQAAQENKLIFLSIGYFSCHWCHVMQRESYSDQDIGGYIRDHYIAVKVDRELRPDLDRRMIRFVEAINGVAGWPLNVVLTPQGYPVTGFTYLPPQQFLNVMKQLDEQWQQRSAEIKKIAVDYFSRAEYDENKATLIRVPDAQRNRLTDAFVAQAMTVADELQGGFGDTDKFPSYPQLLGLMQAIKINPELDSDVASFVQLTLDQMAQRHLRDSIDGGFFRYTTDPDWQTPHFEKMLYDNAQLGLLYVFAESLWPGNGYKEVASDTLEFLYRKLHDEKQGGFYSSLSAVDENGEEGAAYLWDKQALKQALSNTDYAWLNSHWSLDKRPESVFQADSLPLFGAESTMKTVNKIRSRLQNADRPLMPRDAKKIASWNALVLRLLVEMYELNSDAKNQQRAKQHYQAFNHLFLKQGRVIRFADAPMQAETTLEDYAQTAMAVLRYAQVFKDKQAGKTAVQLVQTAIREYYTDPLWIQDRDSLLPGDPGETVIQDNVLSSPSSLLIETILLMKQPPQSMLTWAQNIAGRLNRDMLDTPYYYPGSIMLNARFLHSQSAKETQ